VATACADLSGYAASMLFKPSCPISFINHFLGDLFSCVQAACQISKGDLVSDDIHIWAGEAIQGIEAQACVLHKNRPLYLKNNPGQQTI
jgi:hypothetical protein